MAYAAVLSLNQILRQISSSYLEQHQTYLEQHQTPLQDQQNKSLQEKLSFLLDFLDDSWQIRSEEARCLEREIQDAAYKAEDFIESYISKNFGPEGFQERQMRDQAFCENLEIVADEIDSIKTKAAKFKELWGTIDLHQSQRTSLPTGQSRLPSIDKNDMVGLHDDLIEIMNRLTRYPPALKVIPVIGMGGIGKTTLAKNVYDHPGIALHFDTCAWASISQEYREREVLLSLLDSMKELNDETHQENSTELLKETLYKRLKGRRYLIVMDDVWTTEAWDSLSRIFPDDGMGSRIMLTTRLLSVVDSHSSPYHMQFLDKTDSWNLLCRKVFEEDSCPHELEKAGKEIAESCKGLPLSLVVIGGHLSRSNRTKGHWEYVAQNVKSVVTSTDSSCSEILSLSYDYLPHYLKACFLYMGIFPEDDEIRVSKLIKLWAADGFLKPVRGKTLEEVAEEYLADLISRNLILISKKSSSGKIKTCSIHDLLRVLCIRKAQQEKYFHVAVTDEDVRIFAEGINYSRRLCIQPDIFHKELSYSDTSNVNPSMGSLPPVRSILCSRSASEIYESGDHQKLFPLLRVLNLAEGKVDGFPIGEIKLVHLRYLAFSCDEKISIPKILPDFLWHLQTLIVDCNDVHLPEEIWRMPQLRHLMFGMCYLPCPARSSIDGENLFLDNLLTLSKVSSFSCTREVFKSVPNLKKLGIFIQRSGMTLFSLGNLVDFPELEKLKILSHSTDPERLSVPMNYNFPPNIKKLTLMRCEIPWKYMTIVGLMPNLEVLKLKHDAFDGLEWEPNEGEFRKLKFLQLCGLNLVQWKADDTHFPCLECLIISLCFKLEEIPCSIGDIPTLQIIDLDDASPSAVTSAKQIQEASEELGNDSLQVHVRYVFQKIHRLRKEMEAEIIGGSNDDTLLLKATKRFKIYLLGDPNKDIIPGVVPRLLEFLGRDDYPQLQCEAALAIKRFSKCSSDNINMLIDHDAIPILLSLLRSPKDDLREQALHMLVDFACDSTKSRDLFLSHEVLMLLLAQFNGKPKLSIMRSATKTLSYLCRGEPLPQFEQVKPVILPLTHLICTDDEMVCYYACMALFYLTRESKDKIQAVIDAGVFPRLVDLLLSPSQIVLHPALTTVYILIEYVDVIQIQVIIDKGALPCLLNFLTQDYENDVKEKTCRIISFIIGRTKDHIQAVIEVGIISALLQLLQNADFSMQLELVFAISLAITNGTNEQIKFLVHEGCIKPLCDLLVCPNEVDFIIFCLEGLEDILKVGEAEKNHGNTKDVNVFAQMIDEAGGLQKIKDLQTDHDDRKIRVIAMRTLKKYWPEEAPKSKFSMNCKIL